MEALLHYVWKHKLYVPDNFQTMDGMGLEIIDPGIHNPDAGPDFFNAKIKLDDKLWAGNIEIHTCASDWYRHKHDTDKVYNSVILHVVENPDETIVRDACGRAIPQWVMKVPVHIRENHRYLLSQEETIPCITRAHEIPEIYWTDWKNALATERLERKTNAIFQLLQEYNDDWNEIFYIILARYFGFGVNNDAFERLAKSLPLKYVLKHNDSEQQVQALFLGQAGLLENPGDDHALLLQNEYRFLSKKYGLQPLDGAIFKNLRMRPNSFPQVKIGQLARLASNKQGLFSQMLEAENPKDFHALFYLNGKALGLQAIRILLINTVVPVLFAYGKKKANDEIMKKAFDLLEAIPPEKNFIVSRFAQAGIQVHHAGDSQALIQLKREYCDRKKCIFCRIGHRLLSRKG